MTDQNQNPNPEEQLEQEPEGTVTQGGQKMVPLSAVIEERRAKQAEKAARTAAEKERDELKPQAENWRAVEPYVPLIASHPAVKNRGGKQAAGSTTEAPPAAGDASPEEMADAKQWAETYGLYTDTGEVDVKRGLSAMRYADARAAAKAREAVAPVANTAHSNAAAALRERAYGVVDKQGRPFAQREHIDQVLDGLSAEAASNPDVIGTALLIARGMGTPSNEPIMTEGAGGRSGQHSSPLSRVEDNARKQRGMSVEQWQKVRDDDSMVLE